jgi:hypothetical protein
MSLFFKIRQKKKNAENEQTEHPPINPPEDKGDQHTALF